MTNEPNGEMNEELHPDLAPYLETIEGGLQVLRHPLVVTIMPIPVHANRQYAAKTRQLDAALEAGEYEKALWIYERPYRLSYAASLVLSGLVPADDAGELLLDAWSDSEMPSGSWEDALQAFRAVGYATDSPHRDQPIGRTVWRGGAAGDDGKIAEGAMSWSLDRDTAVWFSTRFGTERPLWETVVTEENLLATVWKRMEFEVVLDPTALGDVKEVER